MIITLVTTGSVTSVVGIAAAAFGAMSSDTYYAFVANTDCWIQQGAAPVATASDGSTFVPSGTIVYLNGRLGAKVSVIQDAAGGDASLTPIMYY